MQTRNRQVKRVVANDANPAASKRALAASAANLEDAPAEAAAAPKCGEPAPGDEAFPEAVMNGFFVVHKEGEHGRMVPMKFVYDAHVVKQRTKESYGYSFRERSATPDPSVVNVEIVGVPPPGNWPNAVSMAFYTRTGEPSAVSVPWWRYFRDAPQLARISISPLIAAEHTVCCAGYSTMKELISLQVPELCSVGLGEFLKKRSPKLRDLRFTRSALFCTAHPQCDTNGALALVAQLPHLERFTSMALDNRDTSIDELVPPGDAEYARAVEALLTQRSLRRLSISIHGDMDTIVWFATLVKHNRTLEELHVQVVNPTPQTSKHIGSAKYLWNAVARSKQHCLWKFAMSPFNTTEVHHTDDTYEPFTNRAISFMDCGLMSQVRAFWRDPEHASETSFDICNEQGTVVSTIGINDVNEARLADWSHRVVAHKA